MINTIFGLPQEQTKPKFMLILENTNCSKNKTFSQMSNFSMIQTKDQHSDLVQFMRVLNVSVMQVIYI